MKTQGITVVIQLTSTDDSQGQESASRGAATLSQAGQWECALTQILQRTVQRDQVKPAS